MLVYKQESNLKFEKIKDKLNEKKQKQDQIKNDQEG